MLLHVLDFDENIVESFGKKNSAIIECVHNRSLDENRNESEILTVVILTREAEAFKDFYRIVIQDENGLYREFVINRTEKENNGYSTIEATASYLIDIGNARPIQAGNFSKQTAKQATYEVLRGTRWELGNIEWAGTQSMSWTSERTPFQMIKQICTAFKLQADFTYEVDDKGISRRLVHLYKKKALFNGKEIKKGKDLVSLKRVSDVTELNTALMALGPENDKGERLRIPIVDDSAQAQFGTHKRYIWGIYEPESEDENMTENRLKSLAKTELNKRKKIDVSYEVDAVDIKRYSPHENVRFGDLVRIKDRDFTPPLYAEAEVVGIEHDLVSDERKYTFGTPKEYTESDLRKYFNERLEMLKQMMNDNKLNVNQIVENVTNQVSEQVEQVIAKGEAPPEEPKEGQLWYDTSNPDNAVLRQYVNEKWENATAEDINKLGGLTREQIIYSELKNLMPKVLSDHTMLQNQYKNLVGNEYLVDEELKQEFTQAFNEADYAFKKANSAFNALDITTATIGQLTDVQSLLVDYRNRVQDMYVLVGEVEKIIDERMKLLQSQYTDEKFNETMHQVANSLPNGQYDEETRTITSDIPNKEALDSLEQRLTDYFNGELTNMNQVLTKDIESKLQMTKEEISASVNSIEERFDDELTPLKSQVTTQNNDIKILKDGITLKADKNEVERDIGSLEHSINETQSNLSVMNDKIDSKVSKSSYKTDVDNIVTRLNSAETQREQLSNLISDKVTISDYERDQATNSQRIQENTTSIEQNGHEISQRVTVDKFNEKDRTYSRILSELKNTVTGLEYIYDENGNIESFTIGQGGTKIDTSKLEIDAGDVKLKDGIFTVKSVNTSDITIPRKDGGVPTIINGEDKTSNAVYGLEPTFKGKLNGQEVFYINGYWLGCLKREYGQDYTVYNAYYFKHDRRYMEVKLLLKPGGTASESKYEKPTGIFVKIDEFGVDSRIDENYIINQYKGYVTTTNDMDNAGRLEQRFVVDLGPPTGIERQFYIKVKPNGEGPSNKGFPTVQGDFAMAKFQIRKISIYG
ncbi:hypothetical protein K0017_05040 [Staphylococcus massiliensis]|uniref:phage tail spike protein n=1 Tax=Staphylococcus massiliensis TaxID=555791 RepID=UPI001EDE6F3D|nr:phage tail spike protein [Staphylococcus massiliensis]MCG3401685.1 hypothetical protein [Staphylococcus massiliensis]